MLPHNKVIGKEAQLFLHHLGQKPEETACSLQERSSQAPKFLQKYLASAKGLHSRAKSCTKMIPV